MIKDNKLWKELIRLFSVEGQPTTAVLVQMYGCIFHTWFSSKTIADHLANRHRPQFINTALEVKEILYVCYSNM
jgi:hypothetical protein